MATAKGTILVTGTNGGLGSALVEEISSGAELSTYHGIYTVRDAAAAPVLSASLAIAKPSHSHDIVSLDLTKLDIVRQVAQGINARVSAGSIPPIRALILNAGLIEHANQSWADDRLDTTFASNYLGHWLLTLLLLQSMDKEAGRIVVLGSQTHDPEDKRNAAGQAYKEQRYKEFVRNEADFEAIAKGTWSTAKEEPSWRSGYRRYGAAKLFLIMMMHELQERMSQEPMLKKIHTFGVDPGTMVTNMQRQGPWWIRVLLFKIINPMIVYLFPKGPIRPTQRSASDVLEASFGPDSGGLPAEQYFNGREPLETSPESRDASKRKLVWRETAKLVHLTEGETVLGNWQ